MLEFPEFTQIVRGLLIWLLLLVVTTWVLSLIRITFQLKYLPRKKDEIFDKLKAVVRHQEFKIKSIDEEKNQIVTEGIVYMAGLFTFHLWGNRVIFQLKEYSDQGVELRVYANASFPFFFYGYTRLLFSRIKLSQSEQTGLITEENICTVVDEVMRD
ncbi:MAG: hypothetical protein ACE5JU_21535 [Candidatus Binatia bacterium]